MVYVILTLTAVMGALYPFAMALLNGAATMRGHSTQRAQALSQGQELANLLNEMAHTNRSLLQLYCDELAMRTGVLNAMGQEALSWPIDRFLEASSISRPTQKAASATQALLQGMAKKAQYLIGKNRGLAQHPLLGGLKPYIDELGPVGVAQWVFAQEQCLPDPKGSPLQNPLLRLNNQKEGVELKNHPSWGGLLGAAIGAVSLQRLAVPLVKRVHSPPLVTTPLFQGQLQETGVLLFAHSAPNPVVQRALTQGHGTDWATILTHPLVGWDKGGPHPEPYLAYALWHKPRHRNGWRFALLYPHFTPTLANPTHRIGGAGETTIY